MFVKNALTYKPFEISAKHLRTQCYDV